MKKNRREYRSLYLYLVVFLIAELSIVITGLRYYNNFEKNFNANIENQLRLISDLKVRELEHWLHEIRGDASTLHDNEAFSDIVKRYFKNPDDPKTKREIHAWLRKFQDGSNYEAVILEDTQLIKKIVIPDAIERPKAYISTGNIDSLRENKLVFEDFYKDESKQKIFLKILIPILDVRQLIGIIELRIDPKTDLYPTLKDWPAPSETSEILILRREGSEAVYVSELRFQKNAALNLRFQLEQKNLPAVRAVLGQNGFMEGIGYHGNAVVAYVEKVPNSSWYLIAQTDESEIYGPLKDKRLETVLLFFSLSLLVGVGIWLFWRNQRARILKERIKSAEALQESEERFRILFDKAPLSYQSLDTDGKLVDINDTWLETFGYQRDEVIGKWFGDFLAPKDVEEFKEQFPLFKETGNRQSEFKMIHKNGTIINIFFVGRIARDIDGNFLQTHGILQDITELKKLELERTAIYEITDGVTMTDNLTDLLKLIHQSVGKVLYAENIFVALYDQNTELFNFPYWVDEFDPIPEPVAMRKSLSSYVFRTRKPILFSPELFQQLKEQNEVELVGSPSPSWIGAPLQTPDKTIGVIVLQHYEKENVYSERDLILLNTIGSQIAMAVERKLSEEAIKREMDFSQSSIDSLPGLFYLFDDQGKFLRWNKNVENITGYSAEELKKISPLELFDKPEKMSVSEKIENVFKIGEDTIEANILSKDKTRTPFFLTGKRFLYENTLCILGVGIDISDRKKAEEDLRNERLLLRTVIDNIPDSIYCKDTASRKTLANLTNFRNVGLKSEAEILGKTDFDFHPKEHAEEFYADDQLVLQTGQPLLNKEEYLVLGNGEMKWQLTSKLPLKDKDGNIIGLVGIGHDITERKQAEEEIKNKELQQKRIIESAGDAMYLADFETKKIILANTLAYKNLGYSYEELLTKKIIELDSEYISDEEVDKMWSKMVFDNPMTIETWHKRKDGSTFPVEVRSSLIIYNGRKAMLGFVRDTSERFLAQQLLKDNEFKFRIFADFTVDWEYWEDENNRLVYMSPSCERLTGYTQNEFFSNPMLLEKIVHPSDLEILIDHHKNSYGLELEKSFQELEFRIIKKDGSVVNLFHTCRPIFDDDKKFLGRRVTNTDITERRKAEEALRESEIKLNVILQSTADGILAIDSNGKIIKTNRRFAELWRIPQALIDLGDDNALLGFVLDQLTNPDEFTSKVQKLYHSTDEDLDNLYFKDGRIFERFSAPLVMDDSSIGRVWSFRNITDRIRAGEEIKLKNEELSKINSEKDKFFSIIAHDLRSPFNGFLGLTQIMAEEFSDLTKDEVQEMAVSMRNSATNLFSLLENLLEWARMQQGLIFFEPKVIELHPIVDECISIMLETANNKGVQLTYDIPEDHLVMADSNMLQTVIRNLVSNAVKFTPKGGEVTLSVKNVDKKYVEIAVKDSGIGMSQSIMDQLFRLDVQTYRIGTDGEPSSGLGLLLCKEFVDKLGGKIWVKSEVGQGSTFYFTVPLNATHDRGILSNRVIKN